MTLAELLVAVRTRAADFPDMPQSEPINTALITLTGLGIARSHEGVALRKILTALAQAESAENFDPEDPFALGPLAIVALDRLVEAILLGELTHDEIQNSLRPFIVGPVV